MPSAADQEFARELGQRIRRARERLGVSQRQLARMARLNRTTIHLIETGRRNPQASTLWSIAYALDRPLDEIVAGIEWVPIREKNGGRWRYS